MNTFIAENYHIQADRPLIGLAPMSSYNDLPFRSVCEKMGADFSIVVVDTNIDTVNINTEVDEEKINSLMFPEFTTQKSSKKSNEKPMVLQLVGRDSTKMAAAAKYYAENGADIIDINLGRPDKDVSGVGAALLSDLEQVRKLLVAIVTACPVPVTVKTCLGIDENNFTVVDIAKIANEIGIKLITVHGRTKAEGYSSKAQFEEVAKIKKMFPKLAVLANGDITTAKKAKQVIEETGCDGVLIGRSAIGDPWLFSKVREALDYDFVTPEITLSDMVLSHIKHIHSYYGNESSAQAKKHIEYYVTRFGLGQKISLFTDQDSKEAQIQKLTSIFANVDKHIKINESDSASNHLSPHNILGRKPRAKNEINEELFLLYDEYQNISAKYNGAKLERQLRSTSEAISRCQNELREQSWFYKLKCLFLKFSPFSKGDA